MKEKMLMKLEKDRLNAKVTTMNMEITQDKSNMSDRDLDMTSQQTKSPVKKVK